MATEGGFFQPLQNDDAKRAATLLELQATCALVMRLGDQMKLFAEAMQQVLCVVADPGTGKEFNSLYIARVLDANEEQREYREQVRKQRAAAGSSEVGSVDRASALGAGIVIPRLPDKLRGTPAEVAYRSGFVAGFLEGRRGSPRPANDDGSERPIHGGPQGEEARQSSGLGARDESARRAVRGAREGGEDPERDGGGHRSPEA